MTKNIIKTGVIGHPIGHSKSPLIHNSWIKQYGLSGEYEAIDIPCEMLEQGIKILADENYAGFNVTIPHKVAIIQLCNEVDDIAKIVGAVNTVVIQGGALFGTNTDVFGFVQNIIDTHPRFSFPAGPAFVLGAGGAARAVVEGLLQQEVPEIRIANRTKSNADELLKYCSAPDKIKIVSWNERANKKHLQDINILINTTSLGMTGKQYLQMDIHHLPPYAIVNDIVYAPLYTDLLKTAQARGNPIVTGIGMLLNQARPAFKLWYGVMPQITSDLQRRILA